MTTHTARGGAGRGVLTEEFRQPHSFRSGRSPAQRQSSGAPDDYVQDLDGAVLIAFPDILVRNVPARLRAALAAAAPRPGPLEFPRLHTLQPGAAHPLFAAYWHSNTAFPRPSVLNCSRQHQGPAAARARLELQVQVRVQVESPAGQFCISQSTAAIHIMWNPSNMLDLYSISDGDF